MRLEGFDEQFFMYCEEVDLCRRARQLGARPTVDPSIQIVHRLSETLNSASKIKFLCASNRQYRKKHWSRLGILSADLATALAVGLRISIFSIGALFSKQSKITRNYWLAAAKSPEIWNG